MDNPSMSSKLSPVFLHPQVIQFNSVDWSSWKIFIYEHYHGILTQAGGSLDPEVERILQKQIQSLDSSARLQLYIKACPFLLCFLLPEKEVRFYTPRLGQELFLLQNEHLENDEYLQLQEYVRPCALLNSKDFPTVAQVITRGSGLLWNDSEKIKQTNDQARVSVQKLLSKMNEYKSTLFERITDWGLALTASMALIRIHLLKFVAMLPSLDHDKKGYEVKRMLLETTRRLLEDSQKAQLLRKSGQSKPLSFSLKMAILSLHYWARLMPAFVVAFVVRWAIKAMARRFIAGETIELATKTLKDLSVSGRDVTLDQLGELVVSDQEADRYCQEVLTLIRGMKLHYSLGEKNKAGINRAHVSIKVSALCDDFRPYAYEYVYSKVAPRLKSILLEAKEHQVFLNIDAEHYDYRNIVFEIYQQVLLETPELQNYQQTGIVVQAYLRDASDHLDDIIELAKKRNMTMPLRLVKGAYWDAETVFAQAHNFDPPEFLNKEETDIMYRQLIIKIFDHHPHVQLAMASHNFSDHCFAYELRRLFYPEIPAIEHQCLHMTYEALSEGMSKMGWAVRNYIPVGSLLVGMAYLVRRIMENSSQVGVLMIMRSHKEKAVFTCPWEVHQDKIKKGEILRDFTQVKFTTEFFNVPPVKLFVKSQLQQIQNKLDEYKSHHLGKTYSNPMELQGPLQVIVSSSDPSLVVGKIQYATAQDAQQAIKTAQEAYLSGQWSLAKPSVRASMLIKAAQIMLMKRAHLAAVIMFEAGKSIEEALADVDEAIDFFNFYAREEVALTKDGDKLISRGVVAVIAPWNFPLAIPAGMSVGALVAGNSVILKSAGPTPLIAQCLSDILYEAGVPPQCFIHLPGRGSEIGNALTQSPAVAQIVFTGSKKVGLELAHKASKRMIYNELFKVVYPAKVTTEMGGKNAIIVTANAELDETVDGILYSAFAHAGQKCSAASRVIVDNRIKDRLLARLIQAGLDQNVKEAFDFSCSINPLITSKEKDRLTKEVEEAVLEAKNFGGIVHIDRSKEDVPGFCMGPVIIELPYKRAFHPESFAQRELFGPVIHVIGFQTHEQAIALFNSTEYGLTGGVFSQSQDDVDWFSAQMDVGNIYINRPITGARVAIEPFGGFKLSGTGPKAGGADYIRHFHVSPYEISVLDKELTWGDDETVTLSWPVYTEHDLHAQALSRAIFNIINDFEAIFQDIGPKNKWTLEQFKSFLKKDYLDYMKGQHKNRTIPGQSSYNQHTRHGEHAVYVAFGDRPDLRSFISLLSALAHRVGVVVLCSTGQSWSWWSSLQSYFYSAGISRKQFKVARPTLNRAQELLRHTELSYVITDAASHQLYEVLLFCFDEKYQDRRMKKVISAMDSFDQNDFTAHMGQFTWTRSFAVNTMRYGAPLELDL